MLEIPATGSPSAGVLRRRCIIRSRRTGGRWRVQRLRGRPVGGYAQGGYAGARPSGPFGALSRVSDGVSRRGVGGSGEGCDGATVHVAGTLAAAIVSGTRSPARRRAGGRLASPRRTDASADVLSADRRAREGGRLRWSDPFGEVRRRRPLRSRWRRARFAGEERRIDRLIVPASHRLSGCRPNARGTATARLLRPGASSST